MTNLAKLRKILLVAIIVVLLGEAVLLGVITTTADKTISVVNSIQNRLEDIPETNFESVILPQMTRQLQQVRVSWFQYTTEYKIDLLNNTENLNQFLEIIVGGIRSFGDTGDAFVFDNTTGEFYFDNSADIKNVIESKMTIINASKDINCRNPVAVDKLATELMWETDIVGDKYLVNLWREPDLTYEESSDLEKYPIGLYKREFDQKIVLPMPGVGNKQIVVVLGVQEEDIIKPLVIVEEHIDRYIQKLDDDLALFLVMTIGCMIGSIVVVMFSNYIFLKLLTRQKHERVTDKI